MYYIILELYVLAISIKCITVYNTNIIRQNIEGFEANKRRYKIKNRNYLQNTVQSENFKKNGNNN
jgi:hypothetical protein